MTARDLFAVGVPEPKRAGSYHAVYADPPWLERGGGQIKRGADRHYPLMPTSEIAALPVLDWAAADAHLYLWVTNNFLEDGLFVMNQWGFRYVTKVTWVKDRAGLGQYFRGMTEDCLFGVRGKLPYRTREDGKRAQGRTVIYGGEPELPAAFEATRVGHSVKPEAMRGAIESVSVGPYLEMFARRPANGWDVWGNQVIEKEVMDMDKNHEGAVEEPTEKPADQGTTEGAGQSEGKATETKPAPEGD